MALLSPSHAEERKTEVYMITTRAELGSLVKIYRDRKRQSQKKLAEEADVSRTAIAHLEQGRRVPNIEILTRIMHHLDIPEGLWISFTREESRQRFEFEEILAELVGAQVSLSRLEMESQATAEAKISELFGPSRSTDQTLDLLNSLLVYYGVPQVSNSFFGKYFEAGAFGSLENFKAKVSGYQKDAIRLFSTFREAYRVLNEAADLDEVLKPLQPVNLGPYYGRSAWSLIKEIPDERLPDLGYISAARVEQESKERQAVSDFLRSLAEKIEKQGRSALDEVGEKVKRRMDSLLRKFQTSLEHGLFSTLFAPDPDALRREAERLAPKTEIELARMAATQEIASKNLANYLTADYLDVYVATSMRSEADFISVNHFVRALFEHPDVRPLKLRYFNPTQSWIDDRIAKGLVEALMLRRSSATIYMAQKSDTFGKDSEASVALGQGKPVIVYVPKLRLPDDLPDPETLAGRDRSELIAHLKDVDPESGEELDESVDRQALVGKILKVTLSRLSRESLLSIVGRHWADFDLYEEATRLPPKRRQAYREWLDTVKEGQGESLPEEVAEGLTDILVAVALGFERRAKVFREIHPLALQVILSSGVLNGILVVRTVQQCAAALRALVENKLQFALGLDDQNYRLIEEITGSTMRVISRHALLRNAFETQYERGRE